jgi:hypothetical protein
MPNSLLEISKVSFREEFSSQIYNSYDVGSKQNGLLVIYRIYLKSFMIFSGLYMCCFGFTKLLGTQTSSKFSAPVVPTWSACMRAWTRGLATSRPTSTWRVPHGLVGSVPARGKQSPSSTALSLPQFPRSFLQHARSAPPVLGRRPQAMPAGRSMTS